MPKVSEEHLQARRDQILDGARRAFSRWGYEGATVSRLESEIGLSRGAIFHYYPSKLDLFVALAADTNRRYIDLIVERGLDEALRAMAQESADWLGVLIAVETQMRHDEDFIARLMQAHDPEQSRIAEWFEEEQTAGRLRADIGWLDLGRFATMVINGLALRVASGDPFDIDATLELLNDALSPRK